MLDAKYSRLKFWIISIILLIPTTILNNFARLFERAGQNENSTVLYILVLLFCLLWINTLANRIRDYGSNPWFSLFGLIPIVNIVLGLYYGIAKTKNKESKEVEKVNSNETSLTKAVYNHTKDIVSEIKPTINEYKENHSAVKNENEVSINTNLEINEDEIYEKVMLEIDEDKKVKSTWAKALGQSEGDDKKATSLYINLRVKKIKIELEKQKEFEKLTKLQEKKLEVDISESLHLSKIIEETEILKEKKNGLFIFTIITLQVLIIIWFILSNKF